MFIIKGLPSLSQQQQPQAPLIVNTVAGGNGGIGGAIPAPMYDYQPLPQPIYHPQQQTTSILINNNGNNPHQNLGPPVYIMNAGGPMPPPSQQQQQQAPQQTSLQQQQQQPPQQHQSAQQPPQNKTIKKAIVSITESSAALTITPALPNVGPNGARMNPNGSQSNSSSSSNLNSNNNSTSNLSGAGGYPQPPPPTIISYQPGVGQQGGPPYMTQQFIFTGPQHITGSG